MVREGVSAICINLAASGYANHGVVLLAQARQHDFSQFDVLARYVM